MLVAEVMFERDFSSEMADAESEADSGDDAGADFEAFSWLTGLLAWSCASSLCTSFLTLALEAVELLVMPLIAIFKDLRRLKVPIPMSFMSSSSMERTSLSVTPSLWNTSLSSSSWCLSKNLCRSLFSSLVTRRRCL